ncbi:MAG: hypothetical protein KZQ81_00360 [Candidatus Thiodiazotropha sp. (ex Rostrolucina anterorostrata)]|nr:hypothetical protein [Candidatus Thiodiazotropha sp. (ex Rostrolucina anterorostrata)]
MIIAPSIKVLFRISALSLLSILLIVIILGQSLIQELQGNSQIMSETRGTSLRYITRIAAIVNRSERDFQLALAELKDLSFALGVSQETTNVEEGMDESA